MTSYMPRGFRDILPQEAEQRERITTLVKQSFADMGYMPIETPLLQNKSSLQRSYDVSDAAFQLFDDDGTLLSLRSDVTPSLARVVATRFSLDSLPLRLRYVAPIVREQDVFMGSMREATQLGVECIGDSAHVADTELVSMAATALQRSGVQEFTVVVSDVDIAASALDALGASEEQKKVMYAYIHASDIAGLRNYVTQEEMPQFAALLPDLINLSGSVEVLDKAEGILDKLGAQSEGVARLRTLFAALDAQEVAGNIIIDLSVMNSFGYYTGLVFEVYAPGVSYPIGSGGRYDTMLKKWGMDAPAAGFVYTLEGIMDALDEVSLNSANDTIDAAPKVGVSEEKPLRIAVPKGSLFNDSVELLKAVGLPVGKLENPGRHLIIKEDKVEYIIVRATDAPAFVASGGADCGICGLDSIIEANLDVAQLSDLKFGACRFVVAEPAGARSRVEASYERHGIERVASKYPRITSNYYNRIGRNVEVVALHGNIELGPVVGMASRIVDITATGTTLRENNLVIVDEVLQCTARFFANPVQLRTDARIRALAQTFEATVPTLFSK